MQHDLKFSVVQCAHEHYSSFFYVQRLFNTLFIPQVAYPTLAAFVEFMSEFDKPNDTSVKKKGINVLETGRPFSPITFEGVLKRFTPDVSNSISGRPRFVLIFLFRIDYHPDVSILYCYR